LILEDILISLNRQGIKKVVILNSHGGNDFKSMIRELQPKFESMFIGVIDWFKVINNEEFFTEPGDHAGEMETSIMQFLFPDWVLPIEEAGAGESRGFKLNGLKEKLIWTPRNWAKVSSDTGIGNPKEASAPKGERFLKELTKRIVDFLMELNSVEPQNIYE
jgi:creatinine amidohydrolase